MSSTLDDIGDQVNNHNQNITDNNNRNIDINGKRPFSFSNFINKRDRSSNGSLLSDSIGNGNMNFVMDLSDNLLVECRKLQAENEKKSKKLHRINEEYQLLTVKQSKLSSNNRTLVKDLVSMKENNEFLQSNYMNITTELGQLKELFNKKIEELNEQKLTSETLKKESDAILSDNLNLQNKLISKNIKDDALENEDLTKAYQTISNLKDQIVTQELKNSNEVDKVLSDADDHKSTEYSIENISDESLLSAAISKGLMMLPKPELDQLRSLIESPSTDYLRSKVQEQNCIFFTTDEYDNLVNQMKYPTLEEISKSARNLGYILINTDEVSKFAKSSQEDIDINLKGDDLILLNKKEYQSSMNKFNGSTIKKQELIKLCTEFNLVPLSQRKYDELIKGPDEESINEYASEFGFIALPRDEYDMLLAKIDYPSEEVVQKIVDQRGMLVIKKTEHNNLLSKINSTTKHDVENMAEKLGLTVLTKENYELLLQEVNNKSTVSSTLPASKVLASKQFFENAIREENAHQEKILASTKKMGFVTLSAQEYVKLKDNQKDHILTKTDIYNGAKDFELTVLPTDEYKLLLRKKNFRNSLTYDDIKEYAARFDMRLAPVNVPEFSSPSAIHTKVIPSGPGVSLLFKGMNSSALSVTSTSTQQSVYFDASQSSDRLLHNSSTNNTSVGDLEAHEHQDFAPNGSSKLRLEDQEKKRRLHDNIDDTIDVSVYDVVDITASDDADIISQTSTIRAIDKSKNTLTIGDLSKRARGFGYRLVPLKSKVPTDNNSKFFEEAMLNDNPFNNSSGINFSEKSIEDGDLGIHFNEESIEDDANDNIHSDINSSEELLQQKANKIGMLLIPEGEYKKYTDEKKFTKKILEEEAAKLDLVIITSNDLDTLIESAVSPRLKRDALEKAASRVGMRVILEEELVDMKEEISNLEKQVEEGTISPDNLGPTALALGYVTLPQEEYEFERGASSALSEEYNQLKEEEEKMKKTFDQLKADTDTLKLSVDQLKVDNVELITSFDELKVANTLLNVEYEDLVENHNILNTKYVDLTISNKALEDEFKVVQESITNISEFDKRSLEHSAAQLGLVVLEKEKHDELVGKNILDNDDIFDLSDNLAIENVKEIPSKTKSKTRDELDYTASKMGLILVNKDEYHSLLSSTKKFDNFEEGNHTHEKQYKVPSDKTSEKFKINEAVMRDRAPELDLVILSKSEYKLLLESEERNKKPENYNHSTIPIPFPIKVPLLSPTSLPSVSVPQAPIDMTSKSTGSAGNTPIIKQGIADATPSSPTPSTPTIPTQELLSKQLRPAKLSKDELAQQAHDMSLTILSEEEYIQLIHSNNITMNKNISEDALAKKAAEFDLVMINSERFNEIKEELANPTFSKEQVVGQAEKYDLVVIDKNEYKELTSKGNESSFLNDDDDEEDNVIANETVELNEDIENIRSKASRYGLLCIPESSYVPTLTSREPDPNDNVLLPSTYYKMLLSTGSKTLNNITNDELQNEVEKRGLTSTTPISRNTEFFPPPPIGSPIGMQKSNSRQTLNHRSIVDNQQNGRIISHSRSSTVSRIESNAANSIYGGVSLTTMASLSEPSIIPALTQTVIGEYLHKYYRRLGPLGVESRHEKYFWIHPYTLTLYWSTSNPVLSDPASNKTKGVAILGVESVEDNNPYPVGLYHKSIIIVTESRNVKFTCLTRQRHNIWFNSLRYLIQRNMEGINIDEIADDPSDNMYSGKIFPLPGENSKSANSRLSGSRRIVTNSSTTSIGNRNRVPSVSSPLINSTSGAFKRTA